MKPARQHDREGGIQAIHGAAGLGLSLRVHVPMEAHEAGGCRYAERIIR